MIVRKLRLQRGWSQEHLAQVTGISVRTIQRIERGAKPGLESAKSLASVFEVDVSAFNSGEITMNESIGLKNDEREAMEFVKGIIGFYAHLAVYLVFLLLEVCGVGRDLPMHYLYVWLLGGWGIGVIIQGLVAYEMFGWLIRPNWEKKMVEKRLGRKL